MAVPLPTISDPKSTSSSVREGEPRGLAINGRIGRDGWRSYDDNRVEITVSGWISLRNVGDNLRSIAGAWHRGGHHLLRECEGDFALVVRDKASKAALLARSPISSRSLFFSGVNTNGLMAASLAADIALNPPRLNVGSLVDWYGGLVGSSVQSMFEGVETVEPGCFVMFDQDGFRRTRFWDAGDIEPDRSASDRELAMGLRDALEAAIRDRLPADGSTASLLSAGRDSGCVSALTARLLEAEGGRLHCFTASPGPDPRFSSTPILMDEWPGASTVAELYPNIDHHRILPRGVRFCDEVEAVYRAHSAPLGNPLSLHWWISAQRAAAGLGCGTMLTGGMGNLTISDGGAIYLSDMAADGPWSAWWRAARDVAAFQGASWLNVLNVSFGGMLPNSAYRLLQQLRGRILPSNVEPFLRGDFRHRLKQEHDRQDQRPPRRSRLRGAQLLTAMDVGDISPDLMFGLTLQDPTADRRVIEAALRIPPERLVSRYDRRPIFELAFGDLLPTETIRAPQRAYQSMDWNFAYDVGELRDGLTRYRQHARIAEMLDIRAMEMALDRWPFDRLATLEETAEFGEGLLRAFALAAFIHVHFPD